MPDVSMILITVSFFGNLLISIQFLLDIYLRRTLQQIPLTLALISSLASLLDY